MHEDGRPTGMAFIEFDTPQVHLAWAGAHDQAGAGPASSLEHTSMFRSHCIGYIVHGDSRATGLACIEIDAHLVHLASARNRADARGLVHD